MPGVSGGAKRGAWPVWLGEEPADSRQLKALLATYPTEEMISWPVIPRVGNVRNNDPSLIEPITLQQGVARSAALDRPARARRGAETGPWPQICPRSIRRTVERLPPVGCAICCCVALAPRLDYGRKAPLLCVRWDRNRNGWGRDIRLRAAAWSPVLQRDARMARKRGRQYIVTDHAERRVTPPGVLSSLS